MTKFSICQASQMRKLITPANHLSILAVFND
jgi:hypothetical protein